MPTPNTNLALVVAKTTSTHAHNILTILDLPARILTTTIHRIFPRSKARKRLVHVSSGLLIMLLGITISDLIQPYVNHLLHHLLEDTGIGAGVVPIAKIVETVFAVE